MSFTVVLVGAGDVGRTALAKAVLDRELARLLPGSAHQVVVTTAGRSRVRERRRTGPEGPVLLVVVREGGLEPPHPFGHWHLKPARLPFRHSRSVSPVSPPA